jgi:hypothetical protein
MPPLLARFIKRQEERELSVSFQRIGGKLDAFAEKMQPLAAKNAGKSPFF